LLLQSQLARASRWSAEQQLDSTSLTERQVVNPRSFPINGTIGIPFTNPTEVGNREVFTTGTRAILLFKRHALLPISNMGLTWMFACLRGIAGAVSLYGDPTRLCPGPPTRPERLQRETLDLAVITRHPRGLGLDQFFHAILEKLAANAD
jgi:hypothetical protein